ncbi:MAG: ElyC/SanA/YdcF family protein [Elainellaceae cyanobacterium]
MPELLTRLLLLGVLVWFIWYVVDQLIPKPYLTVLGGILVVVFFLLLFQDPSDRVLGAIWGILSFPFKPLGLSLLLMGLALKKGIKEINGNLVLWAFIVLWVFSTPLVAYWLMTQTQQTAEQLAAFTNSNQVVEVIVALGDGTNPADPAYRAGTQFNSPADGFDNTFVTRLQYVGRLYSDQRSLGGNPLVIISPGSQLERGTKDVEDDITAILTSNGVPPGNIEVEQNSRDIRSSALAVRRILNDQNLQETGYEVLLVAPASKIRRARAAFARGLNIIDDEVIAAPTDFYGFQIQGGDILMRLNDIVPDAETLTLSTRVVEEYLATIYYFVRGWLLNPLGL